MTAITVEYLTELDENTTKNHPELEYEGVTPVDSDELDYVVITQKGVRIA